MTRPLAPLSRHLLTRSDLAQLGIQAGRILTWLAKGWLDQVGNLPGDDTVGDPVFAVTTRELRDELAQQLRSIGKDTVVFSPMRVRSLLLRAMLPVRGDASAVELAPPPTTMPNEPVPALAPTQDPVTEALLDPAVTGALQLAAEDLEEEVAKVLELAREEAHQEAIERATEHAATAPPETKQPEPESETTWQEADLEEGEDEGEFFDAADLAAELGLLPPTPSAASTPPTPPTQPDEPVETNEQDAAAAEAGVAIAAAAPAPAPDDAVAPTDAAVAPSEPSPVAEPEVASEAASPEAELREPAATDAPAPEPEVPSELPPAPAPDATEPASAVETTEPVVAAVEPVDADADREVEVDAVPSPAEAQPEPGPAPHEEPPELPPMSTQPASHEDVIPTTAGTEAQVPVPTMEAESALDALLAETPAVAEPSAELADAADHAPFVETPEAQQVPAVPAPAPVLATMEVEAPVAAVLEAPVETPMATPVEAPVEPALAAVTAAAPAPVQATAEPQPAVPAQVPEQVTAAAMQRVDSFLGELRHVLVELANRPQQQPAPIDVQPLVAAVQQGFVHAGEQAKATDSALASLTTRLGEFGEKVEHGVALAVHAALGPRTQVAQPVPALVTAPSFVVAKTERSTIALVAIGFLLLCWTGIFWFKTGNTRIAVSTLVGANVVGCCLLLGRNRTS